MRARTRSKCWPSLWILVMAVGFTAPRFSSGSLRNPSPCSAVLSARYTPASQLLAQAHPESQRFWNDFSSRFQESVQAHFTMHSGTSIYEFPVRRNDSHTQFLSDLGFVIPSKAREAKAPPVIEVFEALQIMVQRNIDLGLIAAEDALFPMAVVSAIRADQVDAYRESSDKGDQFDLLKRHAVAPGGNLPGKAVYVENSGDQPATNLLSQSEFYRMIVSGFYPIGGLRAATGTYRSNNEFMHDLAHWSAMIRFPKLMAAVKRSAKQKIERSVLATESDPWGHLLDFIANEGLIVVAEGKLEELPRFLGLEDLLAKNPKPKIEDIERHYRALPENVLGRLMHTMGVGFEEQFEPVGGAARDYVSMLTIPKRQFLYLGLLKRATSSAVGESGATRLTALATFAHFTWLTRHWTPSEWFDFLMSDHNKDSPVYKMIILGLEST